MQICKEVWVIAFAYFKIDLLKTTEFYYCLEKSSKKHTCPNCGKQRFVRYINTQTGQHLALEYGRCDRENNCGYHKQPQAGTRAYFTSFDAIEDHSEKAFKLIVGKKIHYVPKSQTFDITPNGAYIADFILNDNNALAFTSTDARYYIAETGKVISIDATAIPKLQKKHIVFIPDKILKQTQKGYDQNTFIQNLLKRVPFPFNYEDLIHAARLYELGTITLGSRKGAITFPFIDKRGNCRTIQAKQFDETNHTKSTDFLHSMLKRKYEKENKPYPTWLYDYLNNDKFVSCMFGEHLLNRYHSSPVAIVEAPKTAIISTLYFGFPEDSPANFLWLAVYNISSLTIEKCRALHGRNVVLFPDLKAFDKWNQRAKELQTAIPEATFRISDYLERNAPESDKEKGYDLADYLINFDWQQFRSKPKPLKMQAPEAEPASIPCDIKHKKSATSDKTFHSDAIPQLYTKNKPEPWPELAELINYFENTSLPDEPVLLSQWETITDVKQFVDAHLAIVKAQDGNYAYLPYYKRLTRIKQMLIN